MIIQKFIRCQVSALRMRMAQEYSFDSQEVLGFCWGFRWVPTQRGVEKSSNTGIFTEEIAISP